MPLPTATVPNAAMFCHRGKSSIMLRVGVIGHASERDRIRALQGMNRRFFYFPLDLEYTLSSIIISMMMGKETNEQYWTNGQKCCMRFISKGKGGVG